MSRWLSLLFEYRKTLDYSLYLISILIPSEDILLSFPFDRCAVKSRSLVGFENADNGK